MPTPHPDRPRQVADTRTPPDTSQKPLPTAHTLRQDRQQRTHTRQNRHKRPGVSVGLRGKTINVTTVAMARNIDIRPHGGGEELRAENHKMRSEYAVTNFKTRARCEYMTSLRCNGSVSRAMRNNVTHEAHSRSNNNRYDTANKPLPRYNKRRPTEGPRRDRKHISHVSVSDETRVRVSHPHATTTPTHTTQ